MNGLIGKNEFRVSSYLHNQIPQIIVSINLRLINVQKVYCMRVATLDLMTDYLTCESCLILAILKKGKLIISCKLEFIVWL